MNKKLIKNYTSGVPAIKSIQHIEKRLLEYGAKKFLKDYGSDSKLLSISFMLFIDGREIPFRIPSNVEGCKKILLASIKHLRNGTAQRIEEQAERTAWKVIADWIDIQISLVELGYSDMLERFLANVYDYSKEESFYERVKESHLKMLGG